MAPIKRQAIIWTNDGLAFWLMYALLSLNEFSLSQAASTLAVTEQFAQRYACQGESPIWSVSVPRSKYVYYTILKHSIVMRRYDGW